MKIINLGSGSKGNATLIKINTGYILIDCGLSHFQKSLDELNIKLEEIKYVFITHNHGDHIKNIDLFDEEIIFTRKNTISKGHNILDTYKEYDFDEFKITCFKTSHDAPDSCGFIVKVGNSEVVYITDTGKIPAKTSSILKNRRFYIIESNYELTELYASNRPMFLKDRIASTYGHLSNLQCKIYLKKFMGDNTLGFALAHISEECNNDYFINNSINSFNTSIRTYLKQWEVTEIVYDED